MKQFLCDFHLLFKNLTTNETETSTGKLHYSFAVSRDSCHGETLDLQKVSKPLNTQIWLSESKLVRLNIMWLEVCGGNEWAIVCLCCGFVVTLRAILSSVWVNVITLYVYIVINNTILGLPSVKKRVGQCIRICSSVKSKLIFLAHLNKIILKLCYIGGLNE